MHDTVIGNEVKHGAFVHLVINNSIDVWLSYVCKQYWTGISIDSKDMIGSIVFLDFASVFVFLYQIIVVIIHIATSNKTDLAVISHALPIQIQARGFVLL